MARAVELLAVVALLILSGCATVPTGPSVMVLPAAGKSFEQFQTEDALCRQWAGQQVGVPPGDVVNQNTAAAAAAGTLIGAGLGAAIGAASGNPGVGAAIGAGSGLLGGTIVGANAGHAFGADAQWRYDAAFQQCMYAKGNQIPGLVRAPQPYWIPPPPPPGYRGGPPPPSRTLPPPPPPHTP